jgi:hypothetical protein
LYRSADTDMTMVSALAWITMNPTVPFMVDGDLATMWRRFAVATIVEQAEAVRILLDPRLLLTRRLLFRRMVAAVVVAVAVAVAVVVAAVVAGDGESFAGMTQSR